MSAFHLYNIEKIKEIVIRGTNCCHAIDSTSQRVLSHEELASWLLNQYDILHRRVRLIHFNADKIGNKIGKMWVLGVTLSSLLF